MNQLIRLLNGIVTVYMLLLFFRILMTWFGRNDFSSPYRFLQKMTDPYLNYFRRFSFLRTSSIDFSPVVGIGVLLLLTNMLTALGASEKITVGIILSLLVGGFWWIISSISTIAIILIVIRIAALMLGSSTISPFILTVDKMLLPLMNLVNKTLFGNKAITYMMGLLITGALLLIFQILGGTIFGAIMLYLRALPF